MKDNPEYLFDTNCFIEAANRFYGFDFAPSYWEAVLEEINSGRVGIIDRVHMETKAGKDKEDELALWVDENCKNILETKSIEYQKMFQKIINGVIPNSDHKQKAKDEFAQGDIADPWLIAAALVMNNTVVTLEENDPQNRKKILIPCVCNQMGVRCIDLYDFLREIGVKF